MDITARQTVERLQLRRAELMRSLVEGNAETVAVLTEAIARIDARLASLAPAEAVTVRSRDLHLPLWESLTASQKKTIAKQLLCCAMVEADTIHLYFA